ncbi:MAG TPA: alkyl sulfatase C-terminal domain-containing protein [Labilithrix sp.]|jgi:alkyl sulfatase BDS1-like metallo-beta-lactamase superfamily hydrolase|nr:alkyl sulfatase C-terminal domain-containing protein [Labilithrix sp.]
MNLHLEFTDIGEKYRLSLYNGTTPQAETGNAFTPDATIFLTKRSWDDIIARKTTFAQEIAAGRIRVSGTAETLKEVAGVLDQFDAQLDATP